MPKASMKSTVPRGEGFWGSPTTFEALSPRKRPNTPIISKAGTAMVALGQNETRFAWFAAAVRGLIH